MTDEDLHSLKIIWAETFFRAVLKMITWILGFSHNLWIYSSAACPWANQSVCSECLSFLQFCFLDFGHNYIFKIWDSISTERFFDSGTNKITPDRTFALSLIKKYVHAVMLFWGVMYSIFFLQRPLFWTK